MWPLLLRPAHVVRRWLFRVTGWHTRGVKILAVCATGDVLLIRNSYGRRDLWVLPGGGLHRGEHPADGATRELREETGLEAAGLDLLGVYETTEEGWRDTVHVFVAQVAGEPERDGMEVAAARFFAWNDVPEETSAATRRRIKEWRGLRTVTGAW